MFHLCWHRERISLEVPFRHSGRPVEIDGVLWAFDHRVGKGVVPRELILSAGEYGYGQSSERVAGVAPPSAPPEYQA